MINCKQCKYPLTEFDVEFYKNIRKTDSLEDVQCINCLVNRKTQRAIFWKNHTTKYSFFYLFFVYFLIICIPMLILTVLIYYLNISNPILLFLMEIIKIISNLLTPVYFLTCIAGAILVIKEFDFNYDSHVVGSHYETTSHYDGLNVISTTKKVKEYSPDDWGKAIFLGLTYQFWAIPFWIYNNKIRFHLSCPAKVKSAYSKAKKSVDNATIGIKDFAAYYVNNYIYDWRIKSTKNKYSYLRDEELEGKLDSIKKKYVITRIAGKKSMIYEIGKQYTTVIQKKDNEIIIRNILNNFYVYNEWVTLDDTNVSAKTIKNIKRLLR